MFRPNRRRIMKIGIVLIIASVVLFSISMVQFSLGTSNYKNLQIGPSSTVKFYKNSVSAGGDLEYSLEPVSVNYTTATGYNLTSYLISPSGQVFANSTMAGNGVSHVIIPATSGNWTLVVINNNANSVANVSITYGQVDYFTIFTTVFGFVLLPSGIALVGLYYYSLREEKKRDRFRGP